MNEPPYLGVPGAAVATVAVDVAVVVGGLVVVTLVVGVETEAVVVAAGFDCDGVETAVVALPHEPRTVDRIRTELIVSHRTLFFTFVSFNICGFIVRRWQDAGSIIRLLS